MPHASFTTTIIEPPEVSLEPSKPVQPSLKVHPLFHDLALTMATEFGILVAGLALVSLVGWLLGPAALGEFLLLRRLTAWLLTGALLGMATALPRYVAHAVTKPDGERHAYFLAVSGSLLAFTLCVGLIMYFGRLSFARWLFGDPRQAHLILPLCLMLAGLAAHTAVYGYYRGILALGRANAIQLCTFAILPVATVVLLYPTHSVALIIGATGGVTVVANALFALPLLREIARNPLPKLRPYVVELLRYGVGRVPGDFGSAGLFALGPVIAAHYISMTQVGYLLLGSNLLLVMGYTTGPLAVVLLSKFSMMLSQRRLEEVRVAVMYLVGATLDLSVFAALQIVVFADVLLGFWVGPKFRDAIPVVRLLVLAIPPYLLYTALRSSIDSITVKPRNAGNVLVAVTIYLALTGATLKFLSVNYLLDGLAGSLVVALVFLGILTARTFEDLYHLRIAWGRCVPSLLAAVGLGAASLAFRWIQGSHASLVLTGAFELLISGLFLGALIKLGSPWLGFVWKMAFSGRKLAGFAAKSRAA